MDAKACRKLGLDWDPRTGKCGTFTYAVKGTKGSNRETIGKFTEWKYANRFKGLVRVMAKEFPGKVAHKNIRIKQLT